MPPYASYLDVPTAAALAATVPPSVLSAYLAADAGSQAAALLQASLDVDTSYRFQGRRYDTTGVQVNEFPRVAREPSTRVLPNSGAFPVGTAWGETVWDIDPDSDQPVVPDRVLRAVLFQADYLLRPPSGRLDAQQEGVKGKTVGGVREEWGESPALQTGLCRRAMQLMAYYELRTGRLI